MATKSILRKLGLIIILSLISLSSVSAGSGDQIDFALILPGYEIDQDEGGFDRVRVEGFGSTGVVGEPLLPVKTFTFALPPEADLDSLELEITSIKSEILSGTYNIPPVSPLLSVGVASQDSVANRYPGDPQASSHQWIELLPPGAYRQWQAARVAFYPFNFDPFTSELSIASEISIKINFEITGTAPPPAFLDQDLASSPEPTYDLVIITSNYIIPNSTVFASFVSHKEALGYNTLVITETDFTPLTGQSPNGYAERIRQWLIDHYLVYNIRYVLIIGDPYPEETPGVVTIGDVPMKMVWPRKDAEFLEEYEEAPTDYFFADLTGDWNPDGDDYYGEYEDDYLNAVGGVDLIPELVVGRIPIYNREYDELDVILQKIIDYEMELNPTWRENILLPMSYLNPTFDPSQASEQMLDDYLDPAGFSSYTMYMDGSVCTAADTSYSFDEELRAGTMVRDNWAANDYGLVNWSGHGASYYTVVGYEGCYDGIMANSILMTSAYASVLDDDHPSFVFHGSCNNGTPEVDSNLGTSLLGNGAIGTVSASRVSWFAPSEVYGDFDSSLTNFGIAYEFMRNMVEDRLPAGDALYDARSRLTPDNAEYLMNFFNFNLYGDPTVGLDSYGCSAVPLMPPGAWSSTGDFADRIRITWSKTDCANTYQVYHSTGTMFGPYTELVGETNQLYLDYFVSDEEHHNFKVYACNEVGCSAEGRINPWAGYAFVPTIMINEITVGIDRIELFNYGDTNILLEDFSFKGYSDTLDSEVVFTLPAWTLNAGNYVILDDRMKHITPGHIFFNNPLPWDVGGPGAGMLVDANGYELDFVRWGDSVIPPLIGSSWSGINPPAPSSSDESLGRHPNAYDSDQGSNWCIQEQSLLSDNTRCVGSDTIGIYSRTQKTWYLKDANTDGWANVSTVRFGSVDTSWIPVEGDWDGDGTDTIGMYSRTQKTWYLKDANTDGWANVTTVRFGSVDTSWIPVVGDWDDDGTDEIGMYSRTQKTWYLKDANTDGWANVTTVRFGSVDSTWLPVVGDWDDDGTDEIGMYSRTQKTWYLKGANNDGWGDVSTVRFGSVYSSWIPAVGDWDGDGTDEIGMYSRTQKTWYLKGGNTDGWANVSTVRFGSVDTSWLPVTGKW